MAGILLASSILSLIVYGLLVIAAYQRRSKAALPWLVLKIFSFIMDIVVFILAIIAGDVFDAVAIPLAMGKCLFAALYYDDNNRYLGFYLSKNFFFT